MAKDKVLESKLADVFATFGLDNAFQLADVESSDSTVQALNEVSPAAALLFGTFEGLTRNNGISNPMFRGSTRTMDSYSGSIRRDGDVASVKEEYSDLNPEDCPSLSPIMCDIVKQAWEVKDLGSVPDGEELSRYPGDNDEEKAVNWAKDRAVDRYFPELYRLFPAAFSADVAVNMTLDLIRANGVLHVSYEDAAGNTQTLDVTDPQTVFLRRLISEPEYQAVAEKLLQGL